MSANPGRPTGSISVVAFSFMVHDPSGIMPAVEREVLVGQAAQVAEHRRLGVVLREDGVAQDRAPAQQGLGQRVVGAGSPPPSRPEGLEHGGAMGRRGRLAARDPDVVLIDESQEHPAVAGVRDDRRRGPGTSTTTVSKNSRWTRLKPRRSRAAGQVGGAAVDAAGDAAQPLGPVVHGVHGGHDRQQDLGGADVRGRLLAADVLLARLQGKPVGRAGPPASIESPTSRPGRSRSRPPLTAMNAACGPPYQSGTPNRWEEPTATSAPHSPGGLSSVSASRSAATVTSAPLAWASAVRASKSRSAPEQPGYCCTMPK